MGSYSQTGGTTAAVTAGVGAITDAAGQDADAVASSVQSLVKGVLDVLYDAEGVAAWPAAAAPANGVSIAEGLRYVAEGLPGTYFTTTSTVVSSSIPNNTQTAGAITGAAGADLVLHDILIDTDATGLAAPTNIEFSTDNVSGATGAGAPIFLEAIAALGANASESKKDATSHLLPYRLESGKKIFIHGDDAAGTGAGVATVTLVWQRTTAGGTIAAANLP